MLAVLAPVLGRPHRVAPLLDAFAAATPRPWRLVFVADPGDDTELAAIAAAGADVVLCQGSYARKINHAVGEVDATLFFLAADDIFPMPGWLGACRRRLAAGAEVVGVNDLIARRPGREEHATHFLMTKRYAQLPTIDGGRGPLCEAYGHNFVDDELIATASHRGVYAYAADARVRHDHPMAGGEDDETYRIGRSLFRRDRRTYLRRKHLWTSPSSAARSAAKSGRPAPGAR